MTIHTARTIVQQLGGNQFITMTGARNFLADGLSVNFRIPSSKFCAANRCTVILDAIDTYTMTFHRVYGTKVTEIHSASMLYADMIRGEFERVTGLRTSMTRTYA